ncbi:Satratoxin biosynthesis SC1 cluster protein [Lachnellula suecica]|uniref:Satratoxin biosynthesis SC1 cluster protein n=1 Tax=Lachnellula suecica TaxID=602035 RepID=A0A8T9CFC3_9HELO|nr:Satratoxin biosynthesis SC1 cluster protein [Lachnellula suecica]
MKDELQIVNSEAQLICLVTAIEASSCAATNQTCICRDEALQVNATICIATSCTLKESLVIKNATETSCGVPVRSKTAMYNTISTTFGVLSGFVVLLRIASKFLTHAEWGWDDLAVGLTLATGIPTSVLVPHGLTSNGLGRDIWTVTPKEITEFLHVFYASEVLYFAQVALLKLALLFFFIRIFPARTLKRVIQGTIVFDLCFGIAFVFAALFQCNPVSFYWKNWDGEHTGTCVNSNVLAWSNAGISIALDAWMLAIPISQLAGLQLHWKKKLGVSLMFIVGTFITIISIVRLQSLVHFSNSQNPTWDNLAVGVWSSIEINVGIICVCLPNLRLLLLRMFPKVFGSTRNANNQYYTNGSVSNPNKMMNASQAKGDGIMYSRSYTVRHSSRPLEGDEAELIEMKGFDPPQVISRVSNSSAHSKIDNDE